MESDFADLTTLCAGFQPKPTDEIYRENIIRNIAESFGGERQVIIISDGPQTGKTTTLAQFARQYSSTAISYFISSNPWTQNVQNFLYTLCTQISSILGTRLPDETSDFSTLNSLLGTLSIKLAHKAKRTGNIYYFVIDGLEYSMEGPDNQRIIDFLPLLTDANSPFMLASCRSDVLSTLSKFTGLPTLSVVKFSMRETQEYLQSLGLPEVEIQHIHDKYGGIPGHLKVIKDLFQNTGKKDVTTASLPLELEELITRQWLNIYETADTSVKQALEILAAVGIPISVDALAYILGIHPNGVLSRLQQTGFVNYESGLNVLSFSSKISYDVVRNLMSAQIPDIQEKIIYSLENSDVQGTECSDLLSSLYKQTGNYRGIENQLRSEIVLKKLQSEDSLASLYRDLYIACEMAQDESGLDSSSAIMKWGFGISLLKLAMLFPVDEEEVEALLSVHREEEVLRRAYSIAETSTRIRLLTQSYTSLKKRGQKIPGEAQAELQSLIDSLNLDKIDKDLLMQMATELFPLFPDTATTLLEKAIKSSEKRNIIDLALTTATISSPLKPDEQTLSSIKNPDLAYVAKAHSSWLSSLPLVRLREEISNVKSTKAKEYLIRKWCRTNRSLGELATGIELWISEIISDINFPIPLRSLRQVSDTLVDVQDESIKVLVEKLEIPRIIGLDSPKEELVRFLLNLAEAIYRIDPQDAVQRWFKVKQIILHEALDQDTKVYCLARLWVSASRILRDQNVEEIKCIFRQNLEELLREAADHYAVTKGVIKTLILVSPIEAIDVATSLNLRARRNTALGLALGNLLLQRGTESWSDIFEIGFGYSKPVDRQFILSSIFDILEDEDQPIASQNLELLAAKVEELPSSEDKPRYLSILALFESRNDINKANAIAKHAIDHWEHINDLRAKMKVGYRLVSKFAAFNLELAQNLLKQIEKLYLYPEAKIAAGNLGPAFLHSIRLTIRALTLSDFTNHPDGIDALVSLVARIPSREIQKRLYGELAASAYRNGYSQYGERILQEKIIKDLSLVNPLSLETARVLYFCAPVLFEYDAERAKELLSLLPDSWKDNSWHRIVLWKIAKLQLEDEVDLENFRVPVGQKGILSAIEALQNIMSDGLIYNSIKSVINVTENSFDRKKVDAAQALDIAYRIGKIIDKKLPDSENIPHDGYKVVSLAAVHKLKSKIGEKNKILGLNRQELKKEWRNLELHAQGIPNTADRVYVISHVAQEMLSCTNFKQYGEELLLNALDQVKNIPSVVDRSDRLGLIASILEKAGLKSQARFAIEQAVELSNQLEGVERRDLVAQIVQVAHRIAPELATELTLRLDSRIEGMSDTTAKISLQVEMLVENPEKLQHEIDDLFKSEVISRAASKLFEDIVTGTGAVPHERVFNQWLKVASTTDISTFYEVASWVIECMKRRGGRNFLFEVISYMPRFTFELTNSISPQRRLGVSDLIMDNYPGLASKVHVFEEGERDQAIEWVSKWIGQRANKYVKLCDPYFQASEILFFRDIPGNCKIIIVTTDRYFQSDRETIIRELTQSWSRTSSRRIPNILMYIVPQSLDAIFHDRAIVTNGAGLDLGQSLNGLGLKSGKITELEETDARDVESEYIDQMLNQSNWFLNHDRMPTIINI